MLEQDINKIEIKVLKEINIIDNNSKVENLDEIIKKYGINYIRYLFASQNIKEKIEINLDINSNTKEEKPIYYIEKTNINIHNILSTYNKKITKANNFSTIDNQIAYIIMSKLYEFEDIVIASGLKQMPHLICDYLLQLSKLANEYLHQEKIITEDEIYTNERLNLLLAIKIVINNALDLIGIIPREEL